YTFARDLTDTGYNGTIFGYGGIIYGNNNDHRFDYGRDSFIRPQRFGLTGVETIQSGHRLPLLNINPSSVYGIVYDVPDIVPGCALETSGSTTHRLNN